MALLMVAVVVVSASRIFRCMTARSRTAFDEKVVVRWDMAVAVRHISSAGWYDAPQIHWKTDRIHP